MSLASDWNKPILNPGRRIGRNELCPCGSGRKLKHCHRGAFRVEQQQQQPDFDRRGEVQGRIEQAPRAKTVRIAMARMNAQCDAPSDLTFNEWAIIAGKLDRHMQAICIDTPPDWTDKEIRATLTPECDLTIEGDSFALSEWQAIFWVVDTIWRRRLMQATHQAEQSLVRRQQQAIQLAGSPIPRNMVRRGR